MKKFINREEELGYIEEVIEILQSDQHSLRTPIIEFCGIDGIGKTVLLKQIEKRCRTKQVLCKYEDIGEITIQHLASSIQKLLSENKPAMMILDSFDEVNEEEAGDLEIELRNLILSNEKICIVLASKSILDFGKTRSIAHKLKIYTLKPFSRENCFCYLDDVEQSIEANIRELIYEWTQGYPLAMDTMIDTILRKSVDICVPQDQKKLATIIADKIINQTLLAHIRSDASHLSSIQRLLNIMSFPRIFNILILQELIEKYVPEYILKSSIVYIKVLEEINQVASIVNWDITRSGYYMDASIRNIFLLKVRFEDPELYENVNRYLMDMYKDFAKKVPEPDNIHYLREYLYHFAKAGVVTGKPEILLNEIEKLIKNDSAESFLHFYEEFWQDDDLRAALGENAKSVITFMRVRFIELFKKLPEGIGRFQYLLSFLLCTFPASTLREISLASRMENPFWILEPAIRQIMQEENYNVHTKFYAVFSEDRMLKEALGEDFQRILLIFVGVSLRDN